MKKNIIHYYIGYLILASFLMVVFQNCSPKGFTTNATSSSTAPSSAPVIEGAAALTLVSVVSRKTHNSVNYDIPINAAKLITDTAITVEPRIDTSAGHSLIFKFNNPITYVGVTTVVNSDNQVIAFSRSSINQTDAREVNVVITGLANQMRARVILSGLNGLAQESSVSLGFLAGDVDGSGVVDKADTILIKNAISQPLSMSNFKLDIDSSGSIAIEDLESTTYRQNLDLIFKQAVAVNISIPTVPYAKLSQSQFFTLMNSAYRPNFKEYVPQYPLYSDNATKRRFIYLPPNTKVDTSIPDAWVYPQGTIFWKEFSIDLAGVSKKVETRVWEKNGASNGMSAWRSSVYLWNADQLDADLMVVDDFYSIVAPLQANPLNYQAGQPETIAKYKIVKLSNCSTCHRGSTDSALGFNYLQLSKSALNVNIFSLGTQNLLSTPPLVEDQIRGTQKARDAIGYMQTNCATCHSPLGNPARQNFKHSSSLGYEREQILVTSDLRIVTAAPLITFGDLPNSLIHKRLSSKTMPGILPIAVDNIDVIGVKSGVTRLAEWIMEPLALVVVSAPTGLATLQTAQTSVVLQWDLVAGATSYTVVRGGKIIATISGTMYTVIGLTAATNYSFVVYANNLGSSSLPSSTVSQTTLP